MKWVRKMSHLTNTSSSTKMTMMKTARVNSVKKLNTRRRKFMTMIMKWWKIRLIDMAKSMKKMGWVEVMMVCKMINKMKMKIQYKKK